MKRVIMFVTVLLSGATAVLAQPQVKVNLHAATVFLRGAELTGSATVTLPRGESDVIFTNVAGSVNTESLNIGAGNGVIVQSATFQNNYLADSTVSPRTRALQDSINRLEKDVAALEDRKAAVDGQLELLNENKKVAGVNNGLSVAELQKLMDLIGARLNGLLTAQRALTDDINKKNERIGLLQSQIGEEQKKNFQPGGQLLVKFHAEQPTTTEVRMSYVVPNAGWRPVYDLRVESVNAPVKLAYKASVFQNCGVRWNNIELTLSTGNPSEGAQAPVLSPSILSYNRPLIDFRKPGGSSTKTAEQIERMPTTNISDAASLSSQSYQSRNGAGVSLGGGRGTGTVYVVDGVITSGVGDHTSVDASGVNTSFSIDLPYTIPSDGQEHTVAIKSIELPASYRYYVVPKLDKDVFLQARVTNWEDLNLLPASTSVFFEGTYVGQGYIDTRNTEDTLTFSLGRDKKIIVQRERDKNLHSKKVIGTNERQEFAYTISARNTRKEKITLMVEDQVPVSTESDIVVEDMTYGDGVYESDGGKLTWQLELKPAETKKIGFGFKIRYPKGKSVNVR